MQQVAQQRELPERMSWARAVIFAVGFFLLAAILLGQIPGYVYNAMISSSLQGFEAGTLTLGLVGLGGFAIVMVILLLFDPKPLIPPALLAGVGAILAVVGLAVTFWASTSGNHFFPLTTTSILPLLGGNFLWFQPEDIDLVAVGLMILFVGVATVFYSVLAMGEQRNPDRRDLGATLGVRIQIIVSSLLLIVFLYMYNYQVGSALVQDIIIGISVFLALGAFALRLHYLMRPVRKRTMSGLYAVGALGLAQTGAIFLLLWLVAYPLVAWLHGVSFIGLGTFLTNCSRHNVIPGSCGFTQDAASIVDAVITGGFFTAFLLAIVGWRSHRNTVVVGSVVTAGVIALTALLMHTSATALPTAMLLCAGILVVTTIWTISARREFAVVGENNLGCLGMWLMVGTCLFVYLAAFAFFSMGNFAPEETPPNIPNLTYNNGTDAFVMLALFTVLGLIQFFFLVRNRYRV